MKRPNRYYVCSNGEKIPLWWYQDRVENHKLLLKVLDWRGIKNGMVKTCDRCGFQSRRQVDFIVHHRHYRTFEREKPEDVSLLCKQKCHPELHQLCDTNQLTVSDIPFVDPLWEGKIRAGLPLVPQIQESAPECPRCGEIMVLRSPRPNQSWEPFWGCKNFPKCKGNKSLKGD